MAYPCQAKLKHETYNYLHYLQLKLSLNGQLLEAVDQAKLLGVIINNNLE